MNVYDKDQAPNVPELNELGKPTSQKTKAPAKEVSSKWLVACTPFAERTSARSRRLPLNPVLAWGRNHASQRTVLCGRLYQWCCIF